MDPRGGSLTESLNEAPLSFFHLRAMLTAGMGLLTDAYDLFVIGAAATVLIEAQWHPSPVLIGLLGSTSLVAAFVGAFIFGRIADVYGRKAIYGLEAAIMAVAICFAILGLVPGATGAVAFFLIVYAISHLFTEFGPNVTAFIIPAEVYPVTTRTTGHGMAAGIGKVGAFIGVFVFPLLSRSLGLAGTLVITAVFAVVGILLTRMLPEPSGRSLEQLGRENRLAVASAVGAIAGE